MSEDETCQVRVARGPKRWPDFEKCGRKVVGEGLCGIQKVGAELYHGYTGKMVVSVEFLEKIINEKAAGGSMRFGKLSPHLLGPASKERGTSRRAAHLEPPPSRSSEGW